MRGTTLRAAWSDRQIVREYCRRAGIEATFRMFKAELGLRSPYHRLANRVASHLFVTVLANHVVHALRRRLKQKGNTHSWRSIRDRMRTSVRPTMLMRTEAGKVWSQRQDMDPSNGQGRIAAAAGVRFRQHRQSLRPDREQTVPS